MELVYAVPKRKAADWAVAPHHDEHWDESQHEIAYVPTDEMAHVISKAVKIMHGRINYKEPTGAFIVPVHTHVAGELFGSHKKIEVFAVGHPAAMAVGQGVEREFRYHSETWLRETAHISSATELVLHPSYQRIIGLGPAVLPLLLRDLVLEPQDWFWALNAITGENPVPLEDAGDVRRMTEAWIRWGREHGYI
jgi:hypothetical protein